MPEKPGKFDPLYIDRHVARVDLSKKIEREKIIDPLVIAKKIAHAESKFRSFFVPKILARAGGKDFQISFEAMLLNLDLSEIPLDVALSAMDKIVLVVHGMEKNKTGYVFKYSTRTREEYGVEMHRNTILEFLLGQSGDGLTVKEIVEATKLPEDVVRHQLSSLAEGEKVAFGEPKKISTRNVLAQTYKAIK